MFSDEGVIMVEEDPDVIHFDNSSDLPLSTSLNDLDNATLHIDGQSMEVDAPPDIIDLDEDDDIIDDEDALPHDLADSDDEDLVYVDDDDGVNVVYSNVARGHSSDGGGDDHPPTHHIPIGYGGYFVNRGKGTRKPNLGGRKAGRLHTRQETRNLMLKKITDDKGPVPIRFEWDDKKTLMPLGDHASHWSNYLGDLIREMPLYFPFWQKVLTERKAAIVTKIGTQFDLKPHMQSQRWTDINAGIHQHFQKLYNTNKAALKAAHWVINPETETYDVESIRQRRPKNNTSKDRDAQIAFWNDPRNQARAAQNRQNRAKSTVVCQQGSRSLARLRDQMMFLIVFADTEPEQQLAYEDLEQIEKLDLEEMDLKWQMAMLYVRVHKFEQKAGRKIDLDKKESVRFNKQKEIGRKEEDSKALVSVDTLVDWSNHENESDEVIAATEFGMIAGANSEEAHTLDDAGEFALMGVTSE
nr:ribonuclease H-like domain-containing protein [Tanacetum cinerariifolium]